MTNFLTRLPKWLKLSLIFPLLFLNGILLSLTFNYLQPFSSFLIIATILAFLLELLIDLLENKNVPRNKAIAYVLILGLLIVIVIGLILTPLMLKQLNDLINNAPKWIGQTNDFLINQSPLLEKLPFDVESIILQVKQELLKLVQSLGSKTVDLFLGTISNIFNSIIILILTIFFLVAGDKFWEGIFSWFPSPWQQKIPEYFRTTFQDYFFTRLILAGISSVVRLIVFTIIGVPSGILFAFGIGIAGLIPFVGGIVTLGITLLLIFKNGSLALWFFITATVIDQLTDNVLAPRLMGEAIGLNPIWLLISLFIGAKLGGLLGVFLAVPIASVIKRIIDDLRENDFTNSVEEVIIENEQIQHKAGL